MKLPSVSWPAAIVLAVVLTFILGAHALHAPPAVLAVAGALGSALMAVMRQLVTQGVTPADSMAPPSMEPPSVETKVDP